MKRKKKRRRFVDTRVRVSETPVRCFFYCEAFARLDSTYLKPEGRRRSRHAVYERAVAGPPPP